MCVPAWQTLERDSAVQQRALTARIWVVIMLDPDIAQSMFQHATVSLCHAGPARGVQKKSWSAQSGLCSALPVCPGAFAHCAQFTSTLAPPSLALFEFPPPSAARVVCRGSIAARGTAMGLPSRKASLWVTCVILQALAFDLHGECASMSLHPSLAASSSLRPRTDLLLRSCSLCRLSSTVITDAGAAGRAVSTLPPTAAAADMGAIAGRAGALPAHHSVQQQQQHQQE